MYVCVTVVHFYIARSASYLKCSIKTTVPYLHKNVRSVYFIPPNLHKASHNTFAIAIKILKREWRLYIAANYARELFILLVVSAIHNKYNVY